MLFFFQSAFSPTVCTIFFHGTRRRRRRARGTRQYKKEQYKTMEHDCLRAVRLLGASREISSIPWQPYFTNFALALNFPKGRLHSRSAAERERERASFFNETARPPFFFFFCFSHSCLWGGGGGGGLGAHRATLAAEGRHARVALAMEKLIESF